MLSIFLIILTFIFTFCMVFSSVWLFKLYITNHTYVRDIYMILMGVFLTAINVLYSIIFFTKNISVITPIEDMTMILLYLSSVFLTSNIKVSTSKWPANFFNGIALLLMTTAVTYKLTAMYHISIITIAVIDAWFIIINNNSFLTKLVHALLVGITFFLIFFSTIIKNGGDFITVYHFSATYIALNIIVVGYSFHRISDLKKSLGLKN